MKRCPLKRGKPLKRKTYLRARSKTNSYRRRERDIPYMLMVKKLPCAVRWMIEFTMHLPAIIDTPCTGRVEADHAGRRGVKQKAADSTCIPMCTAHHDQRGNFSGVFKHFKQADMRRWLLAAIENTRQEVAWMIERKR